MRDWLPLLHLAIYLYEIRLRSVTRNEGYVSHKPK